ncbi:phage/plasmid replication protein [Pseudomonas sp. NPDC088444]|uniref:phage/plasmid replication domain-containing protein n=1 Tax=Pseudomonas sp. NPDC088444 TaxID=3364456 RepID=UPI00384F32D0
MPIKLLDVHSRLLADGVVTSDASANASLIYLIRWSEGEVFDLHKSAVKVNRARLRRLGIDIGKPFCGDSSVPDVFLK